MHYAVLTGDIVDSSKLTLINRKKLLTNFSFLSDKFSAKSKNELRLEIPFELYRGDSFQCLLNLPEKSLHIALLIRSFLQSDVYFPHINNKIDARIGIGIATVKAKADTLAQSDGLAFQYSGRLLDNIKKMPSRIALKTPWQTIDEEVNTYFALLETIIERWTSTQADVIYYKLLGYTEIAIAEVLKIKQPAVNQRSKAANWHTIELLLKRFETIITKKL